MCTFGLSGCRVNPRRRLWLQDESVHDGFTCFLFSRTQGWCVPDSPRRPVLIVTGLAFLHVCVVEQVNCSLNLNGRLAHVTNKILNIRNKSFPLCASNRGSSRNGLSQNVFFVKACKVFQSGFKKGFSKGFLWEGNFFWEGVGKRVREGF